ncbi:MAG: hypothetical protein GY930_11420 [bacterium]|nr:hypothetical protein [bacterium]
MELSDIRDETRVRYGVSDQDNLFTNTHLTTLINAALRRINAEADWPWMEVSTTVSTTAGSSALTLASDIRRVTMMSYNQVPLRRMTKRAIQDYYGSQGQPRFYAYDAGHKVLPAADRVYTIDYSYIAGSEATLSDGTDEPLAPTRAIDMVISYVCVMMARRERDPELEARFYGEYARTLDKLKDDLSTTIEGMTPRRTRTEDSLAGYLLVT